MELLQKGNDARTAGETELKARPSRSHALFTVHVERCSTVASSDINDYKYDSNGTEVRKPLFNLDL